MSSGVRVASCLITCREIPYNGEGGELLAEADMGEMYLVLRVARGLSWPIASAIAPLIALSGRLFRVQTISSELPSASVRDRGDMSDADVEAVVENGPGGVRRGIRGAPSTCLYPNRPLDRSREEDGRVISF